MFLLLWKGKGKLQMWGSEAFWADYPPEQRLYDTWTTLMIYTWKIIKGFQVMRIPKNNCIARCEWLTQETEFKDILSIILRAATIKCVLY